MQWKLAILGGSALLTTLGGCAFDSPCGDFDTCVDQAAPNNGNNLNNTNNATNNLNNTNNASNNTNNVNNLNNTNNINNTNNSNTNNVLPVNNKVCPAPTDCGPADSEFPFDVNGGDGYGCLRFEDELMGSDQVVADGVCALDDLFEVYYTTCDSNAYILEALLVPDEGCTDEVRLDVSDVEFDCTRSSITRCEILSNGHQRIQLLIRARDNSVAESITFTVSKVGANRAGYTLYTRAFR